MSEATKPRVKSKTIQGIVAAVVLYALGILVDFSPDQAEALEGLIAAALGWVGIGFREKLGGLQGVVSSG